MPKGLKLQGHSLFMELGVTLVFLVSCASLLSNPKLFYALDTITTNRSINDGQTIISSGRNYELGFFSPENSTYRYVGIWYCREIVSTMTVVWVANREAPLANTSGQLQVTNSGNLVLVINGTNHLIWSSNSSKTVQNPIARLLDSGNLVVRDENDDNPDNFLWQSYDHPTDTLFQSMRLGKNFETGQEISLTSWKNKDDPTPGDYTYHCDPTGYPQLFIRRRSVDVYRSGPWNGHVFSGMPNARLSNIYTYRLISNQKEVYFQLINSSVISRAVLSQNGYLQRWTWVDRTKEWEPYFSVPSDICDTYSLCGPYSTCNPRAVPACECLEQFVPTNENEWNRTDWSKGCIRRMPLDCQNGDGFLKYSNIKLPDTRYSRYNESIGLKECGAVCLKNCSCMAYANLDKTGTGCFFWYSGDLIDIRELSEGGQDIYVRMAASELDHDQKEKWQVPVIVISIVSGMLLFGVFTWCMIRKRKEKTGLEQNKDDLELPLYDLATIAAATNNFSSTNMIGEGGFGSVYKGMLSTGQEIAVKRLSKNSGQGVEEFKNEIILISRLQHRNLVRLLGCCLQGEERILIYEYMPNKSLNYFIFDQDRTSLLTWKIRFEIAMGIAKGLLYLHQDSRLRIIHRDLKASNVLLDSELNPKISDFGIARTFLGDQIESKTRHVIGTYGYMSPEYAIDGKFSAKSDVFSFGVLLLEIVSGKRNSGFHHAEHHHSLLGHAWLLWDKGEALDLVDSCFKDSCVESQALRCIQVGLLCVQKFPADRPTMSSVVMMLGSEDVMLHQPKHPGFFIERSSIETYVATSEGDCPYENGMTITILEAR